MRRKGKIADEFEAFIQASSRGRKDWARIVFAVDEETVSVDMGSGKPVFIDRNK